MKIMGTGSRSALLAENDPKAIFRTLMAYMTVLVEKHGSIVFISGMAEGWDEMIAAAARKLELPYICVIPTRNYIDYYWKSTQSQLKMDRRHVAQKLMDDALDVIYLEQIYGEPTMLRRGYGVKFGGPNYRINNVWVHANYQRNQVMVDMCDAALVYNPRGKGGTEDAIERLNTAHKHWEEYPFTDQMLATLIF